MIDQSHEYMTLREELLQAKRYVFERPLIIVALGVGSLTTLNTESMGAMALVSASLILFNFRFTVNRLMSTARIIAYIELELERKGCGWWVGWESCLRYYRKWSNLNSEGANEKINIEMDKDAVPKSMLHYLPIYHLHIALMLAATAWTIAVTVIGFSTVNLICSICVVVLAAIFSSECLKYRPLVISSLVERNRVIWQHVFEYMQEHGAKPVTIECPVRHEDVKDAVSSCH